MPLVFAAQADVNELERLISQYQQIEDDEQGDLLDDFVLSATMVRFSCAVAKLGSNQCSCLPCHTKRLKHTHHGHTHAHEPAAVLHITPVPVCHPYLDTLPSLFFAGRLHICLLPIQAPTVVPSSTGAGPSNQNDITSDAEAGSSQDESDASSSEALSEDVSSRLGSHAGAGPRRLGSIASTYWRPERQDRKENLSVIDERYTAFDELTTYVSTACSTHCNCRSTWGPDTCIS